MKILIVEDDADARELLSDLLEMHAHEVAAAGESGQALNLLTASGFELLITDVSLPGRSGIDLAAQAKSLFPSLQVIVCSGYGEQPVALPFPVEWIQKPIEMDTLLSTITRLSGKTQ